MYPVVLYVVPVLVVPNRPSSPSRLSAPSGSGAGARDLCDRPAPDKLTSLDNLVHAAWTGRRACPLQFLQLLLGMGRRLCVLAAGHLLDVAGGKAAHESQQSNKRDGNEKPHLDPTPPSRF